jgi:predicted lipoprotein with Yx(FWY)xxD motif
MTRQSTNQNRGTVKNRLLKITIAALSVAGLVGGIVVATTSGAGPTQSAGAISPPTVRAPGAPGGPTTGPASSPVATATVRTEMARVAGVTEVILVNTKGLPLYTYKPDTATQSMVTGELAALWPPLVGNAPTGSGTTGALGVLRTGNGRQVTYNGHFLYTFVEDSPGQVTGQGVQNFFVATPALAPNHSSAASPIHGTSAARSAPAYSY